MSIHPTAIVSDRARLGADVSIGPFCVVEDGAELGDGCRLEMHAVVRGHASLGEGVRVHAFCVVGDDPQVVGFDGSIPSRAEVGARTVLREGVTIHRSMKPEGRTVIGADCYLMATAHVGHDCLVEDRVIIANAVLLAGHVSVGTNTFLGGACGVHQYVRIGEGAMVGGTALVTRDVPPFAMAALHNSLIGLNLVGLKRRGFDRADLADLNACYRHVFFPDRPTDPGRLAAELLAAGRDGRTEAGDRFLAFFEGSKRGFLRPRRGGD